MALGRRGAECADRRAVDRGGHDRAERRRGLVIGAGVRNADLAASPAGRERYPLLSAALLAGASGQLRNVARTAGNLLQRTRCRYFQDVSSPRNKRVADSGCPAREGEHADLAILGGSSHCIATHPSDMAVALVALDARVQVRGGGGRARTIALADLHRLPGLEPQRDTILDDGELIVSVELPPPRFGERCRYVKIRDRASFAFALVSAVVALALDGAGRLEDVRIVLGGVAARPWRADGAEASLRGADAAPGAFEQAARIALEPARPLPGNAYKVVLARRLLAATLTELSAPSMSVAAGTLGRVEGAEKVTGAARYTHEHPVEGAAHAVVVQAPVARGTVRGSTRARRSRCPAGSRSSAPTTHRRSRPPANWRSCSRRASPTAGRSSRSSSRSASRWPARRAACCACTWSARSTTSRCAPTIRAATGPSGSTPTCRPTPRTATSSACSPQPRSASTRSTARRGSTTTRWSPTATTATWDPDGRGLTF